MKILALDTATTGCSVGVMNGNKILAEITTESSETHSKRLMPMIRTVLDLSDVTPSEIDGFAVNIGPGSFTGLRIGIGAVKGLAFATQRPVVGIRSTDALASQFPYSTYCVCSLIDARKGQVYCAKFRFDGERLIKETDDQALYPEDAVKTISEPCVFVGTGAILYKPLIQKLNRNAVFPPPHFHMIRASLIAALSLDLFEKNEVDNPATLTPCYVRSSDAEAVVSPNTMMSTGLE